MSLLTGERQSPRKIFFLFFSIYFLIGRKFLYNVVLAFCCTATRISHNYTYITSLLSLPPLPLFHPSRSSQSARLGSLCYIAASHQLSVLHIAVYICWCYFLHSSHSPPQLPLDIGELTVLREKSLHLTPSKHFQLMWQSLKFTPIRYERFISSSTLLSWKELPEDWKCIFTPASKILCYNFGQDHRRESSFKLDLIRWATQIYSTHWLRMWMAQADCFQLWKDCQHHHESVLVY